MLPLKTERISFTVNPNNERYKFEFILGTRDEQSPFGYIGYNVTVTEDEITFYEQRSAMTALATKPVSLSYGRDYEIIFEMDGNWCRFFLVNDAEGVEPWPEFELNVGRFSADTLLIRESVGYSAKISEISYTGEYPVPAITLFQKLDRTQMKVNNAYPFTAQCTD